MHFYIYISTQQKPDNRVKAFLRLNINMHKHNTLTSIQFETSYYGEQYSEMVKNYLITIFYNNNKKKPISAQATGKVRFRLPINCLRKKKFLGDLDLHYPRRRSRLV